VDADRLALSAFLSRNHHFIAQRTEWGTTCFLRKEHGEMDTFLHRLRDEFETSAVPGHFFEMAHHFRLGMGVDSEMFREGLRRLELAAA
jgi:hypothetical protein